MHITKEQLEELYVKQGLTIRQCAEAFGLPTSGGISWRLKKFGITARPAGFQKGNRAPGDRSSDRHGSWKGGKRVVQCSACGKGLFRFPSHIRENSFCDFKCRSKWRSDNFRGESNPNYGNSILKGPNNPNWNGGITHEPYAPIWGDRRFKAGIKERDGYICQNPDCRGNSNTLIIHHIDYDKKNCEPENLITLCVSCNARANFNREFWQAGYKEIIRQKHKGESSISFKISL